MKPVLLVFAAGVLAVPAAFPPDNIVSRDVAGAGVVSRQIDGEPPWLTDGSNGDPSDTSPGEPSDQSSDGSSGAGSQEIDGEPSWLTDGSFGDPSDSSPGDSSDNSWQDDVSTDKSVLPEDPGPDQPIEFSLTIQSSGIFLPTGTAPLSLHGVPFTATHLEDIAEPTGTHTAVGHAPDFEPHFQTGDSETAEHTHTRRYTRHHTRKHKSTHTRTHSPLHTHSFSFSTGFGPNAVPTSVFHSSRTTSFHSSTKTSILPLITDISEAS